MFKFFRNKEDDRNKIKSQALEITSLCKENDQLRFKLATINRKIKNFNYLRDNTFTLINEIESEIERGY